MYKIHYTNITYRLSNNCERQCVIYKYTYVYYTSVRAFKHSVLHLLIRLTCATCTPVFYSARSKPRSPPIRCVARLCRSNPVWKHTLVNTRCRYCPRLPAQTVSSLGRKASRRFAQLCTIAVGVIRVPREGTLLPRYVTRRTVCTISVCP